MADKISTTHSLNIECLFMDGDTRTIKLQNPKESITQVEITDLNALILNDDATKSLLIGDRTGADFYRINKVTKVHETTTQLDLSGNR